MPLPRAPENRRTGMEINPNVKYPDQTEAAMFSPQVKTRMASSRIANRFVVRAAAPEECGNSVVPPGLKSSLPFSQR
jgi:hypothetical protein